VFVFGASYNELDAVGEWGVTLKLTTNAAAPALLILGAAAETFSQISSYLLSPVKMHIFRTGSEPLNSPSLSPLFGPTVSRSPKLSLGHRRNRRQRIPLQPVTHKHKRLARRPRARPSSINALAAACASEFSSFTRS
jgi:hypothetical protein